MRVLLTADTVGGVWDYCSTLASALHQEGHQVLLAILGDVPVHRVARLPPAVEVVARPFRLEWMQDSAEDVAKSNAWLSRLASRWRADVVHLNQFSSAVAPFSVPAVVVAHSDVLSWFGETLAAEAPSEWSQYAERVRQALRTATAVVAPTLYQSRLLERHYGRGADRVIHNGASPPSLPREKMAKPMIVCAARAWDAAKGVEILDRAAERLDRAGASIHLLGGTTSPEGKAVAVTNLTAHGAVERAEVDRWLARAAIYVAPSLYEPFGLAPLEAALHGCALVLSDIGSFRELWDGCAEFFPAGDAHALGEVLASLPNDAGRLDRLSSAARRRAARRYPAERMTGEYVSLYSELRSGRVSRPASATHQPA